MSFIHNFTKFAKQVYFLQQTVICMNLLIIFIEKLRHFLTISITLFVTIICHFYLCVCLRVSEKRTIYLFKTANRAMVRDK